MAKMTTEQELEAKIAVYRAQGLPRLSALRLIRESEASRKVADAKEAPRHGPLSAADEELVAAYRKSGMSRGDALRRVRRDQQTGEKL
jgi:hypothetical protein